MLSSHIRINSQMYHRVFFLLTCRSTEDGCCEMVCVLQLTKDLLQEPIEYKYVIFSPKMKTPDDCYEYLHSFSNILKNSKRCISITGTQEKESFEGTYNYFILFIILNQSPKSISVDSKC